MISPGQVVASRFHVLAQAGKGGTATVYRAFDLTTNEIVALKVFSDESQAENIKNEVCSREAQALDRLRHDSIVKLVDVGRCSQIGFRYIATEWVDGETLDVHLNRIGPVGWQDFVAKLGDHVLSALCHAFEQDVSHRDISPKNILVTASGQTKIIDFGQAKLSNIGVGLTVAGWKTPPYAPPEEDTGRYTYTRDPYSFAALVIRAMAGCELSNHDHLYDLLSQLPLEDRVRGILERALHRDPKSRFENIVALREALREGDPRDVHAEALLSIPIRFLPTAFPWLQDHSAESVAELEDAVIVELNDASAARFLAEAPSKNRIQIETGGYRLVVDIDASDKDHLVVIGASIKRFSLDSLYKSEAYILNATFRHLARRRSPQEASQARAAIIDFYKRIEAGLVDEAQSETKGDDFLAEWSRVLDAMRDLESRKVPPLKYKFLEASGRRLVVELDNPKDAKEEQVRTISKAGSPSWVFRGEIERLEGRKCILYATKARAVDVDEIPSEGFLEHDWSQTRKALDRQASAIKRFRAMETPSLPLRQLLLRERIGLIEPQYAKVEKFFDNELNHEKKALVSQFGASKDLLLIHGPPGTGKTKVIVELIRQEIANNPAAKILLVAQTHVALDHALTGIIGSEVPSAVRIVSGVKAVAPAVQQFSVEARGQQLQAQVDAASRRFLTEEAKSAGVDYSEVELGMLASEVLRGRVRVRDLERSCSSLQIRLQELHRNTAEPSGSTTKHDENRARMRALSDELDNENNNLVLQKGQLSDAEAALAAHSAQGEQLAQQDESELEEWCGLLLSGPAKARLRKLMELSEDWRLKFATSDDFKAAIIASSRIVAGTCVGFCREAAASEAEYDLCIVDEASKATTTELLLPLSRCRRAVLVGDHHQLPPFVEFALRSEELKQKHNLSETILEAQLFESLQRDLGAGQKGRLKLQYRMRGGIGKLISQSFYDGDLDSGLDPNEGAPFGTLTLAGLGTRVVWYDIPRAAQPSEGDRRIGTSFMNTREVSCIVDLLVRIQFVLLKQKSTVHRPTIGVISGYGEQVDTLRREIGRRPELKGMDVECNSVHTFQGREVDICIYSVTRNNSAGDIGFLDDWRHLNVALSRARWHLVVVGSWSFCAAIRGKNPFENVLSFVGADADCERKECADE